MANHFNVLLFDDDDWGGRGDGKEIAVGNMIAEFNAAESYPWFLTAWSGYIVLEFRADCPTDSKEGRDILRRYSEIAWVWDTSDSLQENFSMFDRDKVYEDD